MITVHNEGVEKLQEKISLSLTSDIFEKARDIYYKYPAYRHDPILVKKDDRRIAFLLWKDNNITVSKRKNQYRIATCEDYWDYSAEDEHMDLRLLEEAEGYVFDEIEEYSAAIVRILKRIAPQKKIWFLDERAEWFLGEYHDIRIARSTEEILKEYSELSGKLMHIGGVGSGTITKEKIQNMEYASLQVMHSIYWMSKELCFGEKNPDQRIALIKSPLAFEGIAGTLRYVMTRAESIAQSPFDAKMAVDLGIYGDENQFCNGSGENVWEMFFEPLSDISVTEAYESAHVVLAADAMKTSDPWLWQQDAKSDYSKLVEKYLRFNDKTKAYLEQQYQEIIPNGVGRILGVVGRASDYNMTLPPGYKGELQRPLKPEEILDKTRKFLKEKDFSYAFLATEDAGVFDLFMESDIRDRLLYVPQERVDYSKADGKEYLVDIYKQQENRDGYLSTLKYLGIMNILSKCDALIATTQCGAVRISLGLNGGQYEFIDVPGL